MEKDDFKFLSTIIYIYIYGNIFSHLNNYPIKLIKSKCLQFARFKFTCFQWLIPLTILLLN